MRAVAEWLLIGMSTAAKGNVLLTRRDREFVPLVIHDSYHPLQKVWSIFSATNHDGFGHNLASFTGDVLVDFMGDEVPG